MSGKTLQAAPLELVQEFKQVSDESLMAIERSFFTSISMNCKFLRENEADSMRADTIQNYIDTIEKRRGIHRAICDELESRLSRLMPQNISRDITHFLLQI